MTNRHYYWDITEEELVRFNWGKDYIDYYMKKGTEEKAIIEKISETTFVQSIAKLNRLD